MPKPQTSLGPDAAAAISMASPGKTFFAAHLPDHCIAVIASTPEPECWVIANTQAFWLDVATGIDRCTKTLLLVRPAGSVTVCHALPVQWRAIMQMVGQPEVPGLVSPVTHSLPAPEAATAS